MISLIPEVSLWVEIRLHNMISYNKNILMLPYGTDVMQTPTLRFEDATCIGFINLFHKLLSEM
jgi:hypothetical protein